MKSEKGLWCGALLAVVMLVVASCGDAESVGEPPTPTTTTTSNADPSVTTGATSGSTPAGSTTLGDSSTTAAPSPGYVAHPAGASFVIPEGWEEVGSAIATEFSATAECRSVQIVDQELVEGGPGPSIYRAVAQLCARPDDGGIEAFMVRTYGEARGGFERIELAGRAAYRLAEGTQTIFFVSDDTTVFQLATLVETDPELEEVRTEQVGQILDSLTIDG